MNINRVESSRGLLHKIPRPTAAGSRYGSVNVRSPAGQVGAVHVTNRVCGQICKCNVVGFRTAPALIAIVGFVVNLPVVHLVVVAHVQPVNSAENVLPPLVLAGGCVGRI